MSWRAKSSTPAHTPKMWTLLAGYKLRMFEGRKKYLDVYTKKHCGFRSVGRSIHVKNLQFQKYPN